MVYSGSGFTNNTALTWNSLYELTAISTNGAECERNGYDPAGRRVWNWDGSQTNFFVYDGGTLIAEVDSAGTLKKSYVYGSPGLLAMTTYGASTNTYYMLTDPFGTVHAVTDSSGQIVESYRYDAFGRILGVYDGNNQAISTSAIGNRFLFHGCEYSWKANLYLNGARWYDPVVGRFISKDPSGIANGLNEYKYCNNNPVNFIDPTGEGPIAWANWCAEVAGNGYNRGGVWGGMKVGFGNTLGMFINIGKLQEVEQFSGNAGMYWDECRGKAWGEWAKVGGIALQDIGLGLGVGSAAKAFGVARSGFGELSQAEQYGVGTYNQLRNAARGTGSEVHHLIEKRFAGLVGQKSGNMLSVVLTKAEHQAFTQAWRQVIPYGAGTAQATLGTVQAAARAIYADSPAILRALGL